MNLSRRHILALGGAALATPLFGADGALVFAAASMKGALDDVTARLSLPVRISYGGSGVLARQIMLGAPADLYVSAHPQWMDEVTKAGFARPETTIDLLSNSLVIIGPKGAAPVSLENMPSEGRIAMGYVDAVPAGQYGKAALQALGLWEKLEAQVVQTENVRAAMALVARGELPRAIVYHTDALAEERVDVIARFDPASHPAIRYQLARLTDAGRTAYDALRSQSALDIFRQHGFEVA
ncbi:molybdate ABC transporter substrate-binding protein [Litoreibacter roseus]|uniref:Molybdate ABC transporter substrate-binding protein n=1 Tax=Litoreibacter roseus TaxID=2601869 RepID=A0A6N6JJF1_9RHOB|nr:molybdate ABC transporter substrate-binding protein [Litoreibacter roseus]GFE65322.1 molybdate ABC transporter substrate-binding protein [Litoreibacter roseus]